MYLNFAKGSHLGNEALLNQDALYCDKRGRFFVLCDGFGKAGHLISKEVVDQISAELARLYEVSIPEEDKEKAIRDIVNKANQTVHSKIKADYGYSSSGSTLDIILINDEFFYQAHVGDSRCYGLDTHNELQRLTRDENYVQRLVDQGRASPVEAIVGEQEDILENYIGKSEQTPVTVTKYDLASYKALLLVSDGVSRSVLDEEIRQILLSQRRQEAVDSLIGLALDPKGIVELHCKHYDVTPEEAYPIYAGKDNISVVLINLRRGLKSKIIRLIGKTRRI